MKNNVIIGVATVMIAFLILFGGTYINEIDKASAITEEVVEEVVEEVPRLDTNVPYKYQEIAYEMSEKYDVDYPLIVAVIEIESGGRPGVISTTNDYGLMQINICNHRWLSDRLGTKNFLDPRQNIEAGTYMLARYYKVYDTTNEVLLAYHYGGKKANELIRQGHIENEYVDKIMNRYKEMVEKEINNGR